MLQDEIRILKKKRADRNERNMGIKYGKQRKQ